MKNKLMKLGMQYFADETNGEIEQVNTPVVSENATQPETDVTTTNYEDLFNTDRGLQAFVDVKITKATSTAVKNALEKAKKQQDDSLTEAEKLVSMNETEKLRYQLEKSNRKILEHEKQFNANKLEKETISQMTEKKLPIAFVNLFDFNGETAETVTSKLTLLDENIEKEVEKRLAERLTQSSPKTVVQGQAFSRTDISKMSPTEINTNWDKIKQTL